MSILNFNRILIIGLFFGCLVLTPFADKPLDSNSRNIQAALVLTGGGQKEISEPVNPTNIQNKISSQVSGQTKNIPDVKNQNPDSSRSSSVSKIYQSSSYSGNNIKYFPKGDPDGSSNLGPEVVEWENIACCPNPDDVISNIDFWNSYLNSKDCCPNDDIKFEEEEEEWDFENEKLIKFPDKEFPRRRLLAIPPTPTAVLDKPVKAKYDYSNSAIKPFEYYSKEGKILSLKNRELSKIVYAHSDDLNLLNFNDKIMCPVQPDPTKYQRTECRAITDVGKKEALINLSIINTK